MDAYLNKSAHRIGSTSSILEESEFVSNNVSSDVMSTFLFDNRDELLSFVRSFIPEY